MLDFTQLDRVDGDNITYAGEYFYIICREPCGLSVIVEDTDEDGNVYDLERYAAPSLSVAIATIEALERGEEV